MIFPTSSPRLACRSVAIPPQCEPASAAISFTHNSHGAGRQRLSRQYTTPLGRRPLGHGSPYPSFRRLSLRKPLPTPLPFGWSSKHQVETEGTSVKHAQCILFAPQPLIDVEDLMLLSEEMAVNREQREAEFNSGKHYAA